MNVSASDNFRGQDKGSGKPLEKVSGCLEVPLDLTAVNKREVGVGPLIIVLPKSACSGGGCY